MAGFLKNLDGDKGWNKVLGNGSIRFVKWEEFLQNVNCSEQNSYKLLDFAGYKEVVKAGTCPSLRKNRNPWVPIIK